MQDHGQNSTPPIPGIDTLTQADINEIESLHLAGAAYHYRQMLKLPRLALIKMVLMEMRCKNAAYYFILSEGHYDAFTKYNKQH